MFAWITKRLQARQDAKERAKLEREAQFQALVRAEHALQEKAKLYRACILVAKDSGISVVGERLQVLLLLCHVQDADAMARRLINTAPLRDKRIAKALEDLAVVVRMAHGDDELPKAIDQDPNWVARVMTPMVAAPSLTNEQRDWAKAASSRATRKFVI